MTDPSLPGVPSADPAGGSGPAGRGSGGLVKKILGIGAAIATAVTSVGAATVWVDLKVSESQVAPRTANGSTSTVQDGHDNVTQTGDGSTTQKVTGNSDHSGNVGSGNTTTGSGNTGSLNTTTRSTTTRSTTSRTDEHRIDSHDTATSNTFAEATAGEATVTGAVPGDGKLGMGTTAIIRYTVTRQPNNGNRLFLVCAFVGSGQNNLFYAKAEVFGVGPGSIAARFGGLKSLDPTIIGTTRVCGMVTADTPAATTLRNLMLMDQQGTTHDPAGRSYNLQRTALPEGSSILGDSVTITISRTS
ncbi:MAG: hypothetical protein QOJ50_3284 [Cryptosporangiaceae bacterium]|nr:hypothetical protein [Cryptosporangiaceae bacterium]